MSVLDRFKKDKSDIPIIKNVETTTECIETDDRLSDKARHLNGSVSRVLYGVSQIEATSDQVMDSIRTISAHMTSQQNSVNTTAEIISELGAFSQEVTASVNEVAQSSVRTEEQITQGKKAIQRSVDFIGQIQETVSKNAEIIGKLVDRTLQIERFVSTIKSIASQTNILALNASIEAARAGAEGRGFAVVANEVKKLAENSRESADQIGDLLEIVRTDAANAMGALESSVSAVKEGYQLAKETGHIMDGIMSSLGETNSLVKEINAAVAQQAANNEKLMSVAEQMKEVIEKASVFIETAAFDAEQQKASLQTLLRASNDLELIEQDMHQTIVANSNTNKKKQVYNYGLPQDPATLDPGVSRDTNSNYVIQRVYVGLLGQDADGRSIPAIASTWKLTDDGRTYVFELRDDAYFHHGRKVVAQDVKYSFERLLKPGAQLPNSATLVAVLGAHEFSHGEASEIRGIKVLGEHRLAITLTDPNLVFLDNLAKVGLAIVPKEIVEELGEEFAKKPVGAGPFAFDHWTPGEELVLKAHDSYYEGRPYIDQIVFRVYKGQDEVVKGFLNGEINHARVRGSHYDKLGNHPVYSTHILEQPPVDMEYCALMCHKAPFDNKLVRQAANYAFNRKKYLQDVLKGHAVLSSGSMPPSMLKHEIQGYNFDLAKAKSLMKEAGYPNGYSGEVILHVRANNEEQALRAQAIANDLMKIGISIRIMTLPWSELRKPENMARCHMFLMGASGGHAAPGPYLEPWFHTRRIGGTNRVKYSNPEVDKLLDEAESVANTEKRYQMYLTANKIIVDDAPWMFLFHPKTYVGVQPHVKGMYVGVGSDYQLKHVWIDKE